MSKTLLPFLYQTRTLRKPWQSPPLYLAVRLAHSGQKTRVRRDNSIPFDWGDDAPTSEEGFGEPDSQSTITPSEAHVFKGIFDEISQGKMPPARKNLPNIREATSKPGFATPRSRSFVEQARMTKFRENVLQRYPESLRDAAQVALGLFEFEPGLPGGMIELDEEYKSNMADRAKYERARAEEKQRIETLMTACETDFDLWELMEQEVFSLPAKLGIVQASATTSPQATTIESPESEDDSPEKASDLSSTAAQNAEATQHEGDQKHIMDIHGPLYSHFLSYGLTLFDTAFEQPSLLAFSILPRVKALGLPSYVLGVSTSFYAALARLHWYRYGDITSAVEVIQEMNANGLSADEGVLDLLLAIRDEIDSCSSGAQGPFVSAVMETSPYAGVQMEKLDALIDSAAEALRQEAEDFRS